MSKVKDKHQASKSCLIRTSKTEADYETFKHLGQEIKERKDSPTFFCKFASMKSDLPVT